jgi:hypothetical protein
MAAATIADSRRAASFWGARDYRFARPMKVKTWRTDSSGFEGPGQPAVADGVAHRLAFARSSHMRARVRGFAAISASPGRHRLAGVVVAG